MPLVSITMVKGEVPPAKVPVIVPSLPAQVGLVLVKLTVSEELELSTIVVSFVQPCPLSVIVTLTGPAGKPTAVLVIEPLLQA